MPKFPERLILRSHQSRRPVAIHAQHVGDVPDLEQRWLDLQARSDHSYFTSWSWLGCWLRRLPQSVQPIVLQAAHADHLVGLGIVVAQQIRRRALIMSRGIYLHEAGLPQYDSLTIEHNGFLIERGREVEVSEVLLRFLLEHVQGWDELFLGGLPDTAPLLAFDLPARYGAKLIRRQQKPSPFVDLEHLRRQGRDYLACLSSNTRQQIRRAVRAYSSHGELQLTVAQSVDEGTRFLDDLKRLHQQHWQRKGLPGAFGNPFFEDFHRDLVRDRLEQGEVQLARVSAGATCLGYLYNLVHDGHVYFYQSGFDYDGDAKLKPGMVSHYYAVQHNLEAGARVYDFLASDDQYKKSLSTHSRDMVWAVVQRQRLQYDVEEAMRMFKHRWFGRTPPAEATTTGGVRT